MRTRAAVTWTLVGLAVTWGAARPAAAGHPQEAQALLAELNQRWAGAEARMRVSIPLKDGTDRDGWSESRWMMHDAVDDGKQRFFLKIRVSDRRALVHLMAGDELLAGARFRALGWGFEEPERAKGLFLDLQFDDAPARMRWVFNRRGMSATAAFDADELIHVERYLRFEAFEVRPAAERLVAVQPTAPPTLAPRPPTPTPTPVLRLPELALVVSEGRPAQVRPGGEVRLVVSYQVAGLEPGGTLEVTEIRRLAIGDRPLETFEHLVRRPAGMVTSELPVHVPSDATPGVYAVGTTLRPAGLAAVSDTAFFLVTTAEGAP